MLVAFSFTVGYYTRYQPEPVACVFKEGNSYLGFIRGNSIPSVVIEVLNHSKHFDLAHHSAVGSLSEFGIKNMSRLQHCMVLRCNAMETLIDGNVAVAGEEGALPKLETLWMQYLPSLRSIWEGPVPHGSLGCLKNLTLCDCDEVSRILSRDMIKQLSNLENLQVSQCSGIKEIVEEDTSLVEGEHHHHLLPKLITLALFSLKKLERICCKGVHLDLPSVGSIFVQNCTELTSVLEGMINLTNLRQLILRDCPKVSKIFSREIIQQLSNLDELSVSYCPEIEEIFEEEETVENHSPLPKLKKLFLRFLPKLVSIGCKRDVPFCYPSLEIIEVRECPNLKRLSLGVENTATIEKIEGERKWWEALEWEDDAIKHQLQPLLVQWKR